MKQSAFRRDFRAAAPRRAAGTTPEERIVEALLLGELCLDVFLASLPAGTTREEARRLARRQKGTGGRRPGDRLG